MITNYSQGNKIVWISLINDFQWNRSDLMKLECKFIGLWNWVELERKSEVGSWLLEAGRERMLAEEWKKKTLSAVESDAIGARKSPRDISKEPCKKVFAATLSSWETEQVDDSMYICSVHDFCFFIFHPKEGRRQMPGHFFSSCVAANELQS